MKTCPVCEGKGVTGRLGEPAGSVELFGRDIPLVTMHDQPCKTCRGTGAVADVPRQRVGGSEPREEGDVQLI